MAALSITAANVVPGSNRVTVTGFAGETITAGMAVYKAAATGLWMKSDADSATAEARSVGGIALTGSSLNQPIVVQTDGDITIGATMAVGTIYCLDTGAGGICPSTDVASTEYQSVIGIARTAAILQMKINNSGVAVA